MFKGNSQNLQLLHAAYTTQSLTAALSAPSNQQLLIHSIYAYNGFNSTNSVGLSISMNSNQWKLWTLVGAGPTVSEKTSTIQAGTALTIFPTVTANQGIILQAKDKFGLMSFDISQAETGSPVYEYRYWNGSAWTALTLLNSPIYTATGQMNIIFNPPLDWAVGDNGEGTDTSMYSIRIRATTAPTQAVKIDSLKPCKLLVYRASIAADNSLGAMFKTRQLLLQQGESIIPYFATANAKNTIEIAYQISP
jgi:hypothetical protein